MANLSYKNDEQADERLNPASTARNLQAAEESSAYSGAGADQAEAFANDSANATKEQEENPNSINYTGSGSSGRSKEKTTFSFRGQLKKKGPIGAIIALIIGGGGGLFMLFTPGLAIIQIKEVLTEDLNDQLGAMDIRTTKVFKAKLNDFGKPLSACTVKIRCGFKGMSDRQIKKFEAAGIEVEKVGEKNPLTRKTGVKSLSLVDSTGKTIKVDDPTKLNKMLGDRIVRNTLRKAFNPKFAGFYDNVSAKVFSKFRTSKAEKVTGDTDEERNKSVNDAVAGEKGTTDTSKVATSKDANGNDVDADGNIITPDDAANASGIAADQANRLSGGGTSTKSLFASVAKNGAKSLAKGLLITGAADTACSVKNASRAVESTAKVVRAAQLARFAMIFLTFADQVKAGTATPEQAEYIGNKLTAVDTDKEVLNETSKTTDQKVKNPDFGKNAFDSDGFKVASYNDAPDLSARTMAYTVGGTGLMGKLSSVNSFMQNTLGGKSCKVIQNNFVRIGSLVAGIGVGAISLGASFYAQAGASIAIGMALPLLENYLANMLAGTVVDAKTDGVDAGNAVFAGTAAIQGETAAGRGMKPQNKSELKEYLATTESINDEYIAMETDDAKKTPFDVYNQYSFLGSFARKIIPATATTSTNISSSVATIPQLFSAVASSVLPNAKAVGVFNEERFSKCDDNGYKDLKIDADVFCNVRYGMSAEELSMDTDEVVNYMIDRGYIDGESGTAIPGRGYDRFLAECVNRTSGWGEDQDENSGSGKFCMDNMSDATNDELSHFRVYTMDNSINEAMEYEGPASGPNLDVMTYNVRKDELTDSSKRNGPIATLIQEKQPAIIGFQEMQQVQATAIANALPDYSHTNAGLGGTRRIFWKTSIFGEKPLDEGTWHSTKEAGSDTMPWVKLQINGKILYVFDVHTEPGSQPGAAASQADDAKHLLEDVIPKATKNDGNPIIVTGDMNSGYPGHSGDGTTSFYSNFTKDNTFTLTFNEARAKKNDDCSTGHDFGDQRCGIKNARHIDHIYVSTSSNATVESWENIANNVTAKASDHNPVIVSLAIPGITTGGATDGNTASKDGWAWPVKNSTKADLSNGVLPYQGNGAGQHKGIDIGNFPGREVLAAHSGTVTQSYNAGTCGYFVIIKAEGTPYWMAYQHLTTSGSHPKVGDRVSAGQTVLGKIRNKGENANGCTGGSFNHLHFSLETRDGVSSRALPGYTVDPRKYLP